MRPVTVTMLCLAGCATLPKGPQPNLLDEAQLCQILRALEVEEGVGDEGMVKVFDGPGEPKTTPIPVLVEVEKLPSRWFQWANPSSCKGVRFEAVNYVQDVGDILRLKLKKEASERYAYHASLSSLKDMKEDGADRVACACISSKGYAYWRAGRWVVEANRNHPPRKGAAESKSQEQRDAR